MARLHQASFEKGWDSDDFQKWIDTGCIASGIKSGPLVSFGVITRAGETGELVTMATHSNQRGKGLGRMTLDHLIQSAKRRGLTEIFLEVAEGNLAAKALYTRAEFVPISIRKGYYRRAKGVFEDAIVMKRVLTTSDMDEGAS